MCDALTIRRAALADAHALTRNSQQFHAHLGYRLVGEFYRCGYKGGNWYNMVWMEKMLGEHISPQAVPVPFPSVAAERGW